MIQRLLEITGKRKKKVVGLMSGTSADGVDAALVEIEGCGLDTNFRLIEFITYPFPEDIQERVLQMFQPASCSVEDVCEMNFVLGNVFAQAALAVIKAAGLEAFEVDLIGSHGQTVCHLPDGPVRSTLQIGEPAVIAYQTGIVTVGDFRVADVAAGGQGAPLIPYVDFLLLRDDKRSRAVQNIGGISNVTVLPAGGSREDVLAFDTGPGNMMIDETVRLITDGQRSYDRNGEMASKGEPDRRLLQKLLSHPFVNRQPPKTTGREEFGAHFVRGVLDEARRMEISDADLLATVTAYTAECIYRNYELFILPEHNILEILISGGGLRNLTLMKLLREKFHPVSVRSVEDFGLASDAKEAIAFAILANETIHGNSGNVPGATGADHSVVLGKVIVQDQRVLK
ncbi:anhydro-N-acetylmuramic acid kinase [Candidatus Poribacteria bacterium]